MSSVPQNPGMQWRVRNQQKAQHPHVPQESHSPRSNICQGPESTKLQPSLNPISYSLCPCIQPQWGQSHGDPKAAMTPATLFARLVQMGHYAAPHPHPIPSCPIPVTGSPAGWGHRIMEHLAEAQGIRQCLSIHQSSHFLPSTLGDN